MPNVIETQLTDIENLEISSNKAYVKFRNNQSSVEVSSEIGNGILIESKQKSERGYIAINDHFLASLTFYSKSFPIYLVISMLCLISSLFFIFLSTSIFDIFLTSMAIIVGVVYFIAYFRTKTARLSFRLTNEPDYHILLGGVVTSKHKQINRFIQRVIQNSLKVMSGQEMPSHSPKIRKGPPL